MGRPGDEIIGASVSEPLPSDVNVNFVCLSVCLSVMDRRTYGIATAHASHFFARGSVCYYGYSLSSEHTSLLLRCPSRVTLRRPWFHIDSPSQLQFENSIDYLFDWHLQHGCESAEDTCIVKFFTTRLLLFNKVHVFTVRRTNTNAHTYIQTWLAFNTLMWGSLRLAPIIHTVLISEVLRKPVLEMSICDPSIF